MSDRSEVAPPTWGGRPGEGHRCPECEGWGLYRYLGRDNDEVTEDCPACIGTGLLEVNRLIDALAATQARAADAARALDAMHAEIRGLREALRKIVASEYNELDQYYNGDLKCAQSVAAAALAGAGTGGEGEK